MSFSLNEIEALSVKAARGAGFSWGMANEAAKAARWLCRHDIDGCTALADLLLRMDSNGCRAFTPPSNMSEWSTNTQPVCPVTLGIYLLDRSDLLLDRADVSSKGSGKIGIQGVLEPLLLMCSMSVIARRINTSVSLRWSGTHALTNGTKVWVAENTQEFDGHLLIDFMDVSEQASVLPKVDGQIHQWVSRANPSAAVLETLRSFAARTYAPDNEQSRHSGAGAGLSDND